MMTNEEWEEDENLDRKRHEEDQDSGHADGDQQELSFVPQGKDYTRYEYAPDYYI